MQRSQEAERVIKDALASMQETDPLARSRDTRVRTLVCFLVGDVLPGTRGRAAALRALAAERALLGPERARSVEQRIRESGAPSGAAPAAAPRTRPRELESGEGAEPASADDGGGAPTAPADPRGADAPAWVAQVRAACPAVLQPLIDRALVAFLAVPASRRWRLVALLAPVAALVAFGVVRGVAGLWAARERFSRALRWLLRFAWRLVQLGLAAPPPHGASVV